ncbi:hypothetical protein [Weissella confusa]|uniref:hypothetical protein n=1 Tax=Weissella confusa TaxID=1583 RepID=UPI00107F2451|nr:hypothetical protein [Weissella confusa]TGE67546.1 hypothetical protein C6P17_01940 [Weissella confusa]
MHNAIVIKMITDNVPEEGWVQISEGIVAREAYVPYRFNYDPETKSIIHLDLRHQTPIDIHPIPLTTDEYLITEQTERGFVLSETWDKIPLLTQVIEFRKIGGENKNPWMAAIPDVDGYIYVYQVTLQQGIPHLNTNITIADLKKEFEFRDTSSVIWFSKTQKGLQIHNNKESLLLRLATHHFRELLFEDSDYSQELVEESYAIFKTQYPSNRKVNEND